MAELTNVEYLAFLLSAIGLVITAGIMSGLTLGLMSLDDVEMEILSQSGSVKEKHYARKIRPCLKNPHKLLVTLVLWNAVAAEALPLVLDRITDPVTAVILSVTVVLMFGEIIPQAICSSHGLAIGSLFAPVVKMLLVVTSPVSVPISAILDVVIGHRHSALFRRAQLKTFVDLHEKSKPYGGSLSTDEITIIKGALDLAHKCARAAMTPLDKVFMLPIDTVLDKETLSSILEFGHSRILLHQRGDRRNIIGLLLVKELIMVNPHANVPISSMQIRHVPRLLAETPMYDMLKLFKTGKTHMVVLTEPTREAYERQQRLEEETAIDIDLYSLDSEGIPDSTSERQNEIRPLIEDDKMDGSALYEAKSSSVDASSISSSSMDADDVLFDSLDAARNELEAVGIITIEDVLEELLGDEIIDETDRHVDNLGRFPVNKSVLLKDLPKYLKDSLRSSEGRLPPNLQVYHMGSGSIRYSANESF